MIITTTEHIPNKDYEIIGEVFGLTTRSKNVVKDIGASLKSVVGGEIKSYTEMQIESRNQAIDRLKESGKEMGADAIVMMRFDSSSMGQDMQSITAYGTAVKFV